MEFFPGLYSSPPRMPLQSWLRRMSPHCIVQRLSSPLLWGLLAGLLLRALHHTENHLENREGKVVQMYQVNKEMVVDTESQSKKQKEGEEVKFVRPRFVKDELNITKRILVAVMEDSSGKRSLRENFLLQENVYNWTMEKYVSDTFFFTNFTKEEAAQHPSKVRLAKNSVLEVIREITVTHLDQYHLFYIIPSTAVINGRNLKQYIDNIDPFEQVYVGIISGLVSSRCSLQSGVLLSRLVLTEVAKHLDWCFRNSLSHDESQNLDTCISYAAKLKCQDPSITFPYQVERFSPASLQKSDLHNSTVLYHGINDKTSEKLLLQDLNIFNQKLYESQAAELEVSLVKLANSSKLGNEPVSSWPLGSMPKFGSTERFDRDNFLHFNKTHVANKNDYDIFSSLNSLEQSEMSRILSLCSSLDPGSPESNLDRGWLKMDATRGLDYILETEPGKGGDKMSGGPWCSATRELARPQVIQMPFVTENFKISLIVPVLEKDARVTMTLLKSFAKNSIEKGDGIFLMLVFLYTPERPDKNNNKDFFKDVKQLALIISKKYRKQKDKATNAGTHLLWYSLQTKAGVPSPSRLELMDLVTAKLENKTIILLGSPYMEVRSDFFNRVRMNTVQGRQAFCPAPFTEFHPKVVYEDQRPTTSLSFNSSHGHFDSLSQSHVSFYKSDYLQARRVLPLPVLQSEKDLLDRAHLSSLPANSNHICDIIRLSLGVHVLRAPEPSLRLRYEEVVCEGLEFQQLEGCRQRRTRSLGTRAQLAIRVLRNGGEK